MRGIMNIALEEREEEQLPENEPVDVLSTEDEGIITNALDGISEIRDRVAETVPNGGLNPLEANVVKVAVESLLSVVNHRTKKAISTPQLPEFSSTHNRAAATSAALEAFEETIQALGKFKKPAA